MSYLFGFSGRINRAKMWLFILVTLAFEIVIGVIAVFGMGWTRHTAILSEVSNLAHKDISVVPPDQLFGPVQWAALGIIAVLGLMYLVALLAVTTKRLHDRNKSAWWLIPFVFVPFIVSALKHTPVPDFVAMTDRFNPLGVGFGVAALIGAILCIWAFLELFVFRGTIGENRYGPDPLPPPQS